MFNERKDMNKKIDDAIFYIRYYAGKHGELIERKGQLDDKAKGEYTCKKGYQCFNYLDVWQTEKFGTPQYRTASVSWEMSSLPSRIN
tara:strand:+ start:258 stop:518 length:261 start_codon:yes stop_codon:yes gene_type:complete